MTTPDPRVPWYVDAMARHQGPTMRLLAYMALAGREGVLASDHLQIRALTTPAGKIRAAPGGWGVNNAAPGGQFEAYCDKLPEELTVDVNPTTSAARTDLVVLRVLNPYGGEAGVPMPVDDENGPYWDVVVLHGVAPNITSVKAHDPTMSAITLARIQRPANTGIVTQAHITDLRSLVDLSGERIIIYAPSSPTPPPIAQEVFTESTPCQQATTVPSTQTGGFVPFPTNADWDYIPVPSWAVGVDVNVITNPQVTGSVWGTMRLVIRDGSTSEAMGIIPADYDVNYKGGPGPERFTHLVGGTGIIPPQYRGKVVRMRLEVKSYDGSSAHPGVLAAERGTRVNLWLNFKRYPVTSD